MRSGSGRPTRWHSSSAATAAARRPRPRWSRSGSEICRPIRITGLSDVRGSWNTMAMRRRAARRTSRSDRPSSSTPSKRTLPLTVAASGASPTIASAVSVLPDPDSPMIPSRPPSAICERHAVDDAPPADLDDRSSTSSSTAHRRSAGSATTAGSSTMVDDAGERRRRRGPPAQARVDGVAQAVAEQVEAERGGDHGEAGEHERARVDRHRLLQGLQHASPRRRRHRRQPEVAQRRLGQHGERGDQRELHDDGRRDVRDDVAPHRPPRRRPRRGGRHDVVLRQHAGDLGPHDPGQHDARGEADRQRHRPHRAAERGDEDEGEDQRGQGDQHVDQVGQRTPRPAAA